MQPVAIHHLDEVTIEQSAEDILLSVQQVIGEVLQDHADITAASLATQRSTLVAWDRETGHALAPAISWMDRRCAPLLEGLVKFKAIIHKHTGLPLSPHYLAGKMRWLLDHNPQVKAAYNNQVLMLGSLSSFLCFRLLEEQPYVMDHSHALRSLLCDLTTLKWHPECLSLFKIDERVLPVCVPTQYMFGHLYQRHIPLRSVCGDQNAALHARGKLDRGSIIINLGSGAFMLHPCGQDAVVHKQLLSGIARSQYQHTEYLLEGSVNGAGLALSWLQEQYPDVDLIAGLPVWLEVVKVPPCFINAIGGLGSPWWAELESRFIPPASQDYAKQAVAVIESIVFLLQHNIYALDAQGLSAIYISGGLSQLDGLCQRLADLSGLTVIRHEDPEATARGAAWLISNGEEQWGDQVGSDTFSPQVNQSLLDRFHTMTEVLTQALKINFPEIMQPR
jgi:glycerol kinase